MAKDWSYGALDDLYGVGAIERPAEPRFYESVPRRELRLGLASLCFLVGVMAALVYVWPALLMTQIVTGGMRGTIFWPILAGSATAGALVAWTVTTREQRHWADHWQNVSDWADPPPWK